jgi:Zn-dependent protease with chaperone function
MKRLFFFMLTLFVCTLAFSQTDRNARYVSVQSAPLKDSAGHFAKDLRTLSLGDAVTLVSESGKWSQVRVGNTTGFIASSSLSARRVVASGSTSASASEVALAGKGFNATTENEMRRSLDFSAVDAMERITVPTNELQRFIEDGRLNKGDRQLPFTAFADGSDDFTLQDAYFLGRAVAATLLSSSRPLQNQEATQYVNRICQALVINSPQPEIFKGYYVMILDSNEINAFASPGGHIFITKRLMQLCTSEDMLAAIIAHELAHVMLRHSIEIINSTRFEAEMSEIAGWASATAAKVSPEAARANNFRNSVASTIDAIMTNGYSQQQEYAADTEAVVLLVSTGYDPRAMRSVLDLLQQNMPQRVTGLYSTHPSPAMRINNIQPLMARFQNVNVPQQRAQRFRSVRL